MDNFKKSGGFRKSFGGGDRRGGGGFKPRFNDGDRPKQMFQATCSNCGKPCEVPFRPTGERPVYCRDCFTKMGGGERRDFGGNRGPRNDFSHKKSFGPRQDSRQDFRPQPTVSSSGGADMQALKKQMGEIGTKLDRLIETMEAQQHAKVLSSVVKKVTEKKKSSPKKK